MYVVLFHGCYCLDLLPYDHLPHKGGIVSIDQLTLFSFDSHVTGSVPLVGETVQSYPHVGVGLLKDSSIMGTFSLPPLLLPENSSLVAYMNMTSSFTILFNPWNVPDKTNIQIFCDQMSLSPIELDYKAIYLTSEISYFDSLNCVDRSLDYDTYSYAFSRVFPTNESIMEIMILDDASWYKHHHDSSLHDSIMDSLIDVYLPNYADRFMNFVSIH